MAVTWTISTYNNTVISVVVAHWQASDADGEHTGSSYGSCGFTPDADADGYVAYDSLTEETVIGWVKADVDADAVEASIASQIADSKAPAISTGVPW